MSPAIKPDSPAIQRYYHILQEAEQQGELHEGNVRAAFENLLRETANDADDNLDVEIRKIVWERSPMA